MAEHDDSDVARVLRAAGGRESPSEETVQSVYAAVQAEWRATVEKRRKRRTQRAWLAAAASIALAAVALFLGRQLIDPQGESIANVSRSIGVVQIKDAKSGDWRLLADTRTLHLGERIHTGADGRVALALPDGVSVRLDRYTNVALVSADRIDVSEGAVYIDSGATSLKPGRLQVGTPTGTIRHVGTQYEVRIMHSSAGARVRVREGRVTVMPARGTERTLEMGEQVLVAPGGIQNSGYIEPNSDEWDWASNAAPEFDIDGRPAHEFLAWAAREAGLKVVFATPESAAEARRAVLSGSVSGLHPDEALAAVLPTTNLRSTERDGQLVIELADMR
jgi:ferric-dicitrate binding protein FerR (iron transport regulator)